ncbi:hypothetical protein TNCV_3339381 [Trichonephila clavipes]|nr:hypothetical protein TNCV_3339381 [Trichonephila clavipes]
MSRKLANACKPVRRMFAVFVFSWSLIEEQKREGHVTENSQTTLVLLKVRSIPVLELYIGRSMLPFIEKTTLSPILERPGDEELERCKLRMRIRTVSGPPRRRYSSKRVKINPTFLNNANSFTQFDFTEGRP